MAEDTSFTAASPYTCGWTAIACCDALVEADPAVAQRAIDTAAEILYALSGRQFGLCELTVRPCRLRECNPIGDFYGLPWVPVLAGGQWTNVSCWTHRDPCSCTVVHELFLPGPIDSVTEVLIDGVALDPSNYRVDNRRGIVRTDGVAWPLCQDMNLAPNQPGTYEVTYLRGKPLPAAGQNALATFACEIVKACTGDTTCSLPKRVTSISRQGVTMAILDPMPFLQQGRTGVYIVDAWLAAVNPKARSRGGGILSPDMPQGRRTTWP